MIQHNAVPVKVLQIHLPLPPVLHYHLKQTEDLFGTVNT